MSENPYEEDLLALLRSRAIQGVNAVTPESLAGYVRADGSEVGFDKPARVLIVYLLGQEEPPSFVKEKGKCWLCGERACHWDSQEYGPYCATHEHLLLSEWCFCTAGPCYHWAVAEGKHSYCSDHGGADYQPRTAEPKEEA